VQVKTSEMQKQKEELKKKRGERGERRDAQDRRIIFSYCGTSLVKKKFLAPALTRRGARDNMPSAHSQGF
jgi:hypothetical protein